MDKLLEWSDELSVGIEEIDRQHQALVDILNELHNGIVQKRGSEACRTILGELIEYTRVHFTVEESLFRILAYPGYTIHKREHEKLLEQIIGFQKKIQSEQATVTFELLHFLRNWLTHHILGTDKAYVPHLLAKGIERELPKKMFWKLW